jgi:hypothetical protein
LAKEGNLGLVLEAGLVREDFDRLDRDDFVRGNMEGLPDNRELPAPEDALEKVVVDNCVWLEIGGKIHLHAYVKKDSVSNDPRSEFRRLLRERVS